MTVRAVVFDAYGTLFDVHSVAHLAEQLFPGQGAHISTLWRDKQLEYTRIITMSGQATSDGVPHYMPFWDVTNAALRFTAQRLNLEWSEEIEEQLMAQYLRLDAFAEVHEVLVSLRTHRFPTAILSNGDPQMLSAVLAYAGFEDLFDEVISVNAVRRFKTSDAAYQLGPDVMGIPASELLFVSSNCWDAIAATWFGYQTMWVNRGDLPLDPFGTEPTYTGHSLSDVLTVMVS
jgi:2-haloacid dehalogenase